jgi:competence protein ComEC
MIERNWKYYPALRILLPFAAGIAAARLLQPSAPQLLLLLSVALGLLAFVLTRGARDPALPLFATLLVGGALWYAVRSESPFDRFQGASFRNAEVIGRVVSTPSARGRGVQFIVDCDSILCGSLAGHLRTDLLVRIYDSTLDPRRLPAFGDHISIIGTAAVPDPPANPGEFDYAGYLRDRGVGMTLTVSDARSLYLFNRGDLSWLEELVARVQERARDFADDHVGGREGAIVRALLLGEREQIDEPTRDAFMRTGTVHLLAVSGMHVGIIALALFVVVAWIPNRIVQLLIYMASLGFYAMVAGGGASIVRAVLVASSIMLVRTAGRVTSPLNTLAFAGLVILVASPAELFQAGFQLSFAAVAGVLLLYGRSYRAVAGRFPMVGRRWFLAWPVQLFLLSLAAQLFTLPLTAYYFGYISLISPLTNLVVGPLIDIGLGAGLAGAALSGIGPLAGWFGAAAYLAVGAGERLVEWSAGLPLAGLPFMPVGKISGLLLGGMILYLAFSRGWGSLGTRIIALASLALCLLTWEQLSDPLKRLGPADLLLLHTRNGIAVARVRGDTLALIGGNRDVGDSDFVRFTCTPLARRVGARSLWLVPLDSAGASPSGMLAALNERPGEYAMRDLPVIVSNTSQRRLRLVEGGGEGWLQVPLKAGLDEALLLHNDRKWEEIAWR